MKLQTATRLALFAVLELAAEPERQLSAAEIAARHDISLNHLAKVLRDLSRAGLVEAVRGVGGGYRFRGNIKRTTLMDVIQVFEPAHDRGETVDTSGVATALSLVLKEIDDTIQATLQSISIETMVKLIAKQR